MVLGVVVRVMEGVGSMRHHVAPERAMATVALPAERRLMVRRCIPDAVKAVETDCHPD